MDPVFVSCLLQPPMSHHDPNYVVIRRLLLHSKAQLLLQRKISAGLLSLRLSIPLNGSAVCRSRISPPVFTGQSPSATRAAHLSALCSYAGSSCGCPPKLTTTCGTLRSNQLLIQHFSEDKIFFSLVFSWFIFFLLAFKNVYSFVVADGVVGAGTVILIFAFPILFIVVAGCVFLHLMQNSNLHVMQKSNGVQLSLKQRLNWP